MKILNVILLLILVSCQPFAFKDEDKRNRDRKGNRDTAKGESTFELPDLKELDFAEVKKKVTKDCRKYDGGHSFSLFGKYSITKPIVNCLAKAIDEGLAPTCQAEKDAKALLAYYEKEGDKAKADEVEEYLDAVEETKYEHLDYIYELGDIVDDHNQDLIDEIDADGEDSSSSKAWKRLLGIGVKSELGSITRTLDSKARLACHGNIDFSRITRERR